MTKAVDIANAALLAVGHKETERAIDVDALERAMYQEDILAPYGRSPAMQALSGIRPNEAFFGGGRRAGKSAAIKARLDEMNMSITPLWIGCDEAGQIDQSIISSLSLPRRESFTNFSTATDGPPPTALTVQSLLDARALLERNNVPLPIDNDWLQMHHFLGHVMMRPEHMVRLDGGGIDVDDYDYKPLNIRPETAARYKSMMRYPEHIAGPAGMTARLIDDDQKCWDESDSMRHCLNRYYRPKIERGEFIAYHIDTPTLFKHGFTCCYSRKITYGPVEKGKVIIPEIILGEWQIDQIRGKANSTSNDRYLQQFADNILMFINEAEAGSIP